jgi:hypothetical protein
VQETGSRLCSIAGFVITDVESADLPPEFVSHFIPFSAYIRFLLKLNWLRKCLQYFCY